MCTTPALINYGPLVATHMNPPIHSNYSIDVCWKWHALAALSFVSHLLLSLLSLLSPCFTVTMCDFSPDFFVDIPFIFLVARCNYCPACTFVSCLYIVSVFWGAFRVPQSVAYTWVCVYSNNVNNIGACAHHLSAIECHYRVLVQHCIKPFGVAWPNMCE
jgi:hypothetical protein